MAGNIPGSSVVPDVFQAGAVSVGDNTGVNARATNEGALVIQEINGKYAELVRRGYVFSARVGTAQALPAIATFSNGLTLFNRSSSSKIVYPLMLNLSYIGPLGATIGVWTNFGVVGGYIYGCGDAVAAGQPLSTMGTALGALNMLAGAGPSAYTVALATIVCSAPYAATFPVGQIFDLGLNQIATGTLTAGNGLWANAQYIFEGISALKPSTALVIGGTGTAAALASMTWNQTIIWAEIPVGSAVLP